MPLEQKKLGKSSLNVSRIGLGTVEIGLPYGIGVGRLPSEKEAEDILKSAVEMGITYFDTARGYGVAEERIGKFGISRLPGIVIGTKCGQFLEKGVDPRGQELEKLIRGEVEESLRNLKLERLQLLQFHGGSKEQIERGELINVARRLIEEGKVEYAGIATRGEEAPMAAIESGFFKSIQTAYSILDQRMSPWVFPTAKKNGVGIINRSVLLKGALTQAVEQLPAELSLLKETSHQAAFWANDCGVDLPTLAIRFAVSNPAITTVLIGTTDPKHLKTAIAALESGPLPDDLLGQLSELGISDPALVDPAYWPSIN